MDKEQTCLLFCGGKPYTEFNANILHQYSGAFIVAADSGLNALYALDIVPNMMIGDMDSVDPTILEAFRKAGVEEAIYPARKNLTDTEIALELLIQKGFKKLILLGATGDRIDHSIANVFLLRKLCEAGIEAELITPGNRLFCIKESRELRAEPGSTVSFIALTDVVTNVYLEGFEYKLTAENLYANQPGRAVSNIASKPVQRVTFDSGILLADIVNTDYTH